MLIPGETLLHKFVIPFVYDEIEQVVISYKQDDKIVYEKIVTKSSTDAKIRTKDPGYTEISYELKQTESLLFSENPFEMQVNVYTTSHSRATSKPIKASSGIQFLKKTMPKGDD